ncbi:ankyrin repeat domain-containing protein SOWAHC [Menidia menidia]
MGDVSEESLLDYFYSAGGNSGRVRNADMLRTFKPFIGHGDPELRAKYREEFKLIIDRIAVVKSENGEKYLCIKKKYRQLLQDRDNKHQGADGEQVRHLNLARSTASAEWEVNDAPTSSPNQWEQQEEPLSCGESDTKEQQTGTQQTTQPPPAIRIQEPSAQSHGGGELDRDSGSKSESEQDEESTGSMGSPSLALDPIEKDWIYSAASARVPDLSQLLRQDPALANKKDFISFSHCPVTMVDHLLRVALSLCHLHSDKIARSPLKCATVFLSSTGSATGFSSIPSSHTALHWAAKHGNEDMAALVANAGADVNIKSHLICVFSFPVLFSLAVFGPGKHKGGYTPLHIAALHGHQHILDLLIGTYGAKENLRDYSGHLACHYLNIHHAEYPGPGEDCELQFQVTQARERIKNRKLVSLFHSKKKWGSAEELAPIEEEKTSSHQLVIPAFRPRKFSR